MTEQCQRGWGLPSAQSLRDNQHILLKTVLGPGVGQRLLLKPKFHYFLQKIQPLVLILRQMNPLHILTSCTSTVTTFRTGGDIPPLPHTPSWDR